jgi:transcriptional regulator with XRE-family HTH domain
MVRISPVHDTSPDTITEIGRRVRAARAYSGMGQVELAGKVGISLASLKRVESGHRLAKDQEQRIIAAVCGVPLSFITDISTPPSFDHVRAATECQALRAELADLQLRPTMSPTMTETLRRARNAITGAIEAAEQSDNGDGG